LKLLACYFDVLEFWEVCPFLKEICLIHQPLEKFVWHDATKQQRSEAELAKTSVAGSF